MMSLVLVPGQMMLLLLLMAQTAGTEIVCVDLIRSEIIIIEPVTEDWEKVAACSTRGERANVNPRMIV